MAALLRARRWRGSWLLCAALLVGACSDDGGSDATDPQQQADGAADASDPENEPAARAVSEVTVEPLDAPRSSTEIRVGEIIVEFDGEVTDDGTLLTIEEPILFDFDSADLRPGSKEALDEIAEVLAFYADAPVELVGHTDDVGGREYNLQLSSARAESVVGGLVRRGIPADRLSHEGRAFDEPVASNETEEGRAQNRRVEVLIVGVEPPADQ